MKGIKLESPWKIDCVTLEKPVPAPGEALIRVCTAGICGSDIGAYRGKNKLVSYPRIIGHELAGMIEAIPADNPKGLKVGDRVVVDPYLYCGECYPCRIGRTNCCTSLKVLGVHIDGGMAEYYCHPAAMLEKIPADMDWLEAALAEPLTISLHGIHRGRLKAGEYCVIIGAGPIGLLAGLAAQVYGAHTILIDFVQERLDFAAELGIEYVINPKQVDLEAEVRKITSGTMAQLVMECSGANEAVRSALNLVSHAGRITLTGWPPEETLLPTDVITKKEIDICGARTSAGEFAEAIDLIYQKKIDVLKLLTKVVALADVPEAVVDIERNPGNYMKVVVDLRGDIKT